MIVVHSVGPYAGIEVYWGIEDDIPPTDRKVVSYAWLIEDLPPYRKSRWGARLRAGRRALHFGLCTRGDDPYRRDIAPIDEISEWRRPHAVSESEAGSADPGGESVGSDVVGEPLPGVGVGSSNGHTPH